MPRKSDQSPHTSMPIPADDLNRTLTIAQPDNDESFLISESSEIPTPFFFRERTAGRFCLIDMHVPPGGGPPPHRHDFEETFTVLEGELEVTFAA